MPARTPHVLDNIIENWAFYDTVLVTLPPKASSDRYVFFRDMVNKNGNLTNVTQVKRLPSYHKLKLQQLEVQVFRWGGDDLVDMVWALSSLRVRFNQHEIFNGFLAQFKDKPVVPCIGEVSDRDDINVDLHLDPSTPEDWKGATTLDYRTKQVVTTSVIEWPEWLKAQAELHDGELPKVQQTRTEWELYTRPIHAQVAVRVSLRGTLELPLGY